MNRITSKVALAVIAAHPGWAYSQTAAGADSGDALEVVVVTAQKREDNLQVTGLTAAVLSSQQLIEKQVETIEDLQFAVPSLSSSSAALGTAINIRGIGVSAPSPNVVGGVAVYRDGLFQPGVVATEPFFDMANIQVLRGPQGTFVGTTSTGGAIFYESANASTTAGVEGQLAFGYGNYNHMQVTAAVNVPVSDTFAVRFAGNTDERGSFFEQRGTAATTVPGTYREPGKLDQRNLRVNTLWEPNEKLRVITKTAVNKNQTDGLATIPTTVNPGYRGVKDYILDYNVSDTQFDEATLRQVVDVSYELANGVTVRSISGYQDWDIHAVVDFDSTSTASRGFRSLIDEQMYSQEVNLVSRKGGKFDWVAGAYYLDTVIRSNILITQPIPRVNPAGKNLKTSRATYGHIGYKLTDAIQLEAGLRYTWSGTRLRGTTTITTPAPVPVVNSQNSDQKDSDYTGKLGLNWTISPDQFFYAFVAKGYKPGGVNGSPEAPDFDPETVYDYELGLKSTFLDGRVRTQVNGFYMSYQDLQTLSFLPPIAPNLNGTADGVVNARGTSTIYGAEAQIQGRIGGFQGDMGVGYVKSKLGTVTFVNAALVNNGNTTGLGPQCGPGVTGTCYNYLPATFTFSGRSNPYSPEWTFNIGLQYTFKLGEGATTLTPRVDYSYTGGQYQTAQQDPADYQEARSLINGSLVLERGDWSVEAWGTNLGNKIYIGGTYSGPSWFLLPPRQFGLRLRYSF